MIKNVEMIDIYELRLPRGSAQKLAEIAERKGYQDDCEYLVDLVVKHIEENK